MSLEAVAVAIGQRWRRQRRRRSGIVAQCSSWECLSLSSVADEATSVGVGGGGCSGGAGGGRGRGEALVAKGENTVRYETVQPYTTCSHLSIVHHSHRSDERNRNMWTGIRSTKFFSRFGKRQNQIANYTWNISAGLLRHLNNGGESMVESNLSE